MYIISEAFCFLAYFFNDICNSLGKSIRWPKRRLGWIPAIGPTDDGPIEVATFVVRTLLSRRFIFLRIIALRATLAATAAAAAAAAAAAEAAEKSSPCLHALL